MEPNAVKAALTVLIAFLLKLAADALGIQLDVTVFFALAGAIVTWFLVHFGWDGYVAIKAARARSRAR